MFYLGGPRAENREDKKKKKKTTDMQTPTYRVLRNSEAKLGTLEPVYDWCGPSDPQTLKESEGKTCQAIIVYSQNSVYI